MVNSSRIVTCGLVVVLLALSAGCATARVPASGTRTVEATGEAFLEDVDRDIGAPAVEWESIAEGQGWGFPAVDAVTPEQKRQTALKAARYGALADLPGRSSGTEVRQESSVRNMQFAGETVAINRAGVLEGVQVVKEDYDSRAQVAEVVVRVGLDKEGRAIPEKLLPITPLSLEVRRARAEHAARVQALAALRERIGEVLVTQEVRVKNLLLSHQKANVVVEGMLEGAEFSEPQWLSPKHVRVRAKLTISDVDLDRLRGLASAY